MNKKFLSVILFSALMVGTAGTFTSCKDYDDDIDQINKELTDIKSSLSALQAKVDAGKYVTNVTKSGDGIVVTWNDNSTSTIETIKGDKGDKGDKVEITIDPTTKNWKIDGTDTGICAEGKDGGAGTPGAPGAAGKDAKSPTISEETGNWVVYAWDSEKQEYVGTDTGVSAKGASAYVVDKGNYYELNVAVDKAGSAYTTVKLPKTPVVITEIEVMGQVVTEDNGKTYQVTDWSEPISYNFVLATKANADKWNKLDGAKKLKEGQALSTLSNGNLLVRIAPAALDASEFSFKMVNSKLGEAPMTLGTPTAFNGLLTRAVSGNGLWAMPLSANEGETYKKEADYKAKFTVGDKAIAYALQEADGFTTLYNLSFEFNENIDLAAKPIKLNDKAIDSATDQEDNTKVTPATIGELLTVKFDNPQNVYDAYVEIDEATIVRWGITDINGLSFKIGKLADNITTTYFPITIHYVALDGMVKSTTTNVKPAKSLNGVTTLPSQNIEISATVANNKKDYSLTPMFEDLAGSALILWKADVADKAITVYRVESTGDVVETGLANAVTFDKSALKDITKLTLNVDAARTTAYKLDKSYYAKIDFKDANGEILNTVKAPFTLSIPALSKFLVKENVVFGTTSTGKAYMNVEDQATPYSADGVSRYAFKHAFNKFDNVYANNSTIKFAIDPAQKIGNTVIVGNYAKLVEIAATATQKPEVAIELIASADGSQKAYHTPINIVIAEAKYLGIYPYGETERAANAFKLDVMSPIEQGTVEAASAAGISVVATSEGVAKLYEKDFKAATYAGIAYKIFKDKFAAGDTEASLYTSPYISDVTFESANTNVFTVEKNGVGAKKNGNKVEEGYVEVTPKNAGYDTTEKLNVTVKDIWGYTKKADINVTVKPNSAN